MKKILVLTVILFWVFSSISPYKVVYIYAQNASQTKISDLIALYSTKYNVPTSTMVHIVNCESRGNTKAHNLTSKEDSWGLVQINLKAHKNITKKQATDPDYALDYLAKNIKAGKKGMWTCAKKS